MDVGMMVVCMLPAMALILPACLLEATWEKLCKKFPKLQAWYDEHTPSINEYQTEEDS